MTGRSNELQHFCSTNEAGITCCSLFLLCFWGGRTEVKSAVKTGSCKAIIWKLQENTLPLGLRLPT